MDFLLVDIHTQHTSLCSLNAIFICVIILVEMCFHIFNLCWFKHKKIFEYFRYSWKVFCLKNLKISKIHFCPVLATQSRVSQVASLSRVFAGHFWRLVREWKVQSRGLLRDFRGLARDSLTGRPSSHEKHLENFFKLLSLSVLAAWTGIFVATHFSREKRVFGKNRGSF